MVEKEEGHSRKGAFNPSSIPERGQARNRIQLMQRK